jgi:DNA polymerase I-like protein with 3'-5' exonuclease and polymerase domains
MLARHQIWTANWLLDTEYMWSAWEAELDKSLANVASIALPDFMYWKAEIKSNILEYNAKDTVNTARVLMWLLQHMPDWAWHNYAQMVPLLIPTVVSNLEGFATDDIRLKAAETIAEAAQKGRLAELAEILGDPDFKPGSPKALSTYLYQILGPLYGWTKPHTGAAKKREAKTGKTTTATDSTSLKALALQHPVAARISGLVLDWRKNSKANSTYYKSHLYGTTRRLFYSFRVDGTKTGRFSCTASALRLVVGRGAKGQIRQADIKNYGNQIQNSPPYYKEALCADEGYLMGNADKSKSEAECVALLSGDKAFTEALHDTSLDFYLRLAEWFFGVTTHNNKELPIRQVTKKINHASSYCMGVDTFIDQVGVKAVYEYMALVGWKGAAAPRVFVQYLLDECFHGTFPSIKKWWMWTTRQLIEHNGYLRTPDGAVRHFWKVPKSPRALMPDAVAHQPQRLSVVTLNRNFAQVFYEVQLPSQFALRLKGQVHDSIVFQYRAGREDLAHRVKEIMERPYETALGTLAIPIDLEYGTKHWKEPKLPRPCPPEPR